MRVVFLGTSRFAIPSLRALADSRHEVPLVVTAPTRPRGRGQRPEPPPVALEAERLGLPVFQPESISSPESVRRLRAAEPDLAVVVAYGQILSERVLSIPPLGAVNVHASLLPRWRGAAPIARAIQAGDRVTGVSLQFVTRRLDAGDVIDRERVEIGPDETAGELAERLAVLGATVLARNLDALERGEASGEPQDESAVTWAKPLTKEDAAIRWCLPAERVHDHVRALSPWPVAQSVVETPAAGERDFGPPARRERLLIHRTRVGRIAPPEVLPGTVVRADDAIEVQTGYGTVEILELQRPGRRPMKAASFLQGFPLPPGTRMRWEPSGGR